MNARTQVAQHFLQGAGLCHHVGTYMAQQFISKWKLLLMSSESHETESHHQESQPCFNDVFRHYNTLQQCADLSNKKALYCSQNDDFGMCACFWLQPFQFKQLEPAILKLHGIM